MCKNNYSEAMQKTKSQRQAEILPVIQKLNSMHIKPAYNDKIKEFYGKLQEFINNGEKIDIDVPVEGMNIRIVGVLEAQVNRKTWLKMTALEPIEE
jgi:hypothetical protein